MKVHRDHRTPRISGVRPLERADLAALQQKSTGNATVSKMRDSHHVIARLIASGLTISETAARAGYSATRVGVLVNGNPAMQELIAKYRDIATKAWAESQDEYYAFIYSNGLKAQRMIADQLDEADEKNVDVPLNRLLSIAADSADRVGYTKKSTTLNINVDFAAKLEAARKRSAKVIDATAMLAAE
jgi:hypothetical protein